jgi:hypothetical protein
MDPFAVLISILALITPMDPTVERKIKLLNHEQYVVRRDTQKELEKMGWKAIPWLKVYSTDETPEIAQRASYLVRQYYKEPDKFPWFSPPSSDPIEWSKQVYNGPIGHRHRFSGCNPIGSMSVDARQMTAEWYRQCLNFGIPRETLTKQMDAMRENERKERAKIYETYNLPADYEIDESIVDDDCDDD